jgi:hypothetical protein
MEPREYLAEIVAQLVASAIVAEVTIVEEYTLCRIVDTSVHD